MIWPNEITTHDQEPHFVGMEKDTWEAMPERSEFKHCTYCGSIRPEDFYTILKENKCFVELADRKYGYPHKFYINLTDGRMAKFYTRHLIDIKDEATINEVLDLIREKTKVNLKSHLDEK